MSQPVEHVGFVTDLTRSRSPQLPPRPTSQGLAFSAPAFSAPPSTVLPQFSGSGTLLSAHCATAQYTLIDNGPTALYVPFMGCMNSQPECCPFTPASSSQGVYPRPHDAKDAVVRRCPPDYYSVSGSCCPRYTRVHSLPFTPLPAIHHD